MQFHHCCPPPTPALEKILLASGHQGRSRSRQESEVFGWSRIPNNTGSQISLSDSGSPIGPFLHRTPKLRIPVEMVQFLLKWYNFCWNFCWNRYFLLCPRFPLISTAKIHSFDVTESEFDIFPPTPQPWWPPLKEYAIGGKLNCNCFSTRWCDWSCGTRTQLPTCSLLLFCHFH